MTDRLTDALHQFGVSNPQPVAESQIATVWRVRHHGTDAALKLYKNGDTHDEWPGCRFLHGRNGAGAVRIFAYRNAAVLMEWLNGPSLGDLSRSGRDAEASRILANVGQALHTKPENLDLPDLWTRFAALLDDPLSADRPEPVRGNLRHCQSLAHTLLDSQKDIRPLHGDLHHDNIKQGTRGYLAFDAKGVLGDRAYDYANAFMNPIDAPQITNDPARIRQMATTFAVALDLPAVRLMQWATAHCALSIMWSGQDVPATTFALLDQLIVTATQSV